MQSQSLEQLYSFFVFVLVGFLIGLLFDFFRISRKVFKTSDIITSIEDVTFWIISGILVLFSIFKFNNGDLRLYILIAISVGLLFYILIFSKIVIGILVNTLLIIKKLSSYVIKIVLLPLKLTLKLIKKYFLFPISIIIKKIKLYLICLKNKNKTNIKKDFV